MVGRDVGKVHDVQQELDTIQRVGTLEVAQDLRFQRRAWAFQRAGWLAMALALALAVAGVFGHGVVSKRSATSRDGGVKVEYPAVTRHRTPETLRITPAPGAVEGDELRLSLSRETLDGMEIETVYPEPDSVETGADETVYVFSLADDGTTTEIIFSVLFDDMGRRHAEVTVEGHQPVEFSQFVLP